MSLVDMGCRTTHGDTVRRVRLCVRHFLDMPEDVPVPARRMAGHLTLIARAATAGQGGPG
jgi:hypothetical protein